MKTLTVIDISKHQATIDFTKVKTAVDGVILRCGYRTTTDQKFFEYVRGCKENDIPIYGVYFFSYGFNEPAVRTEAEFCVKLCVEAGLNPHDIWIFYDFEYDTVERAREAGVILGPSECRKHTEVFCNRITELGWKVGVYANLDYYKNWYGAGFLSQYTLWLADYKGDPDVPCMIQQYTSSGQVPGIKGNVDMNRWFVSNESCGEKTILEIANEVLEGKWGNGPDRKNALEAAGYNYKYVQDMVNELLYRGSLRKIADDVISGKYGNGDARYEALAKAGYDPVEIQKMVNERYK